jgi:uncharacterized membrane protein (UPF0127 family)
MTKNVTIANLDGPIVCERCVLEDSALRRMRGLLGRKRLDSGQGILIRPAPAIHTWFMRFAIDAVFLDRNLNVLSVRSELRPWRMASQRGARAVLELPAGEAERRDIHPGDRLEVSLGGI